jgi:hypothetical protein
MRRLLCYSPLPLLTNTPFYFSAPFVIQPIWMPALGLEHTLGFNNYYVSFSFFLSFCIPAFDFASSVMLSSPGPTAPDWHSVYFSVSLPPLPAAFALSGPIINL